jgi:membrane associated rhomboid family serine protease
MGIHDRDYARDEAPPGGFSQLPVSIQLVIVNVGLFLADMVAGEKLSGAMAVGPDTLQSPWLWWQFLTYGFAHSPENIRHIFGNMLILGMFGRHVEAIYGRREYLTFYLTTIVLGGVIWAVRQQVMGIPNSGMLGASGGVVAIFVLFALHFPKQTVLLGLFIPVPAWLAGLLMVLSDVALAFLPKSRVAFDVHLVGAAFAASYFFGKWRLSPWLNFLSFSRSSRLRVRSPDDERDDPYSNEPSNRNSADPNVDMEADRILEKLHREGQASLTRKEKKLLEAYSRRMRQRRQ